MRRLVVVTIASAVACVALLAAFDVPSALREKLRPWILARLDNKKSKRVHRKVEQGRELIAGIAAFFSPQLGLW